MMSKVNIGTQVNGWSKVVDPESVKIGQGAKGVQVRILKANTGTHVLNLTGWHPIWPDF